MQRKWFATLVTLAAVLVCAGLSSEAVAENSYLTLKGGVYVPQGDLDSLNEGPSVEVAYGFRIIPLLWAEVAGGYFRAEESGDEFRSFPVTLNAKVRLPIPVVTPYLLGGIGIYFSTLDVSPLGSDSDTGFGYQLGAGVDAKILMVQLGLEAKYFKVSQEFHGESVDPEGVLAMASVGLRF